MREHEMLLRLLRAGRRAIHLPTFEETHALEVIRAAAVELNRPMFLWCAHVGVREGLLSDARPIPETADPIVGMTWLDAHAGDALVVLLDVAAHLGQARGLRALRQLLASTSRRRSNVLLVDHADTLPPVLQTEFERCELPLPDDREIETLVKSTLREANSERPLTIDIPRTALQAVIANLRGLSRRQIAYVVRETVADDHRFDEADVARVLAAKRRAVAEGGLLQFVEAPVSLDEIGGLNRLKDWLLRRERAISDAAREFGLQPPRGLLLLGVQGAGKSLCAKAAATAWRRPLLRLDAGALYDKYVGESERNLRSALHQAERMAPAIVWIDEIEKAFASAAAQSTDGGLSKRMFGSLLTWMQEHRAPVFLVATANDIEALPPELLRKGRFDEIFFVDLPTPEARRAIFEIHLRRRNRDPQTFDLDALTAAADGFSGAEIEQAVIAALYDAFAVHRELTTADIVDAVLRSPPLSVTMAERIANLRAWAADRCVPAD